MSTKESIKKKQIIKVNKMRQQSNSQIGIHYTKNKVKPQRKPETWAYLKWFCSIYKMHGTLYVENNHG